MENKNEACPNCGYCPHCGRRDIQPKWVPNYPQFVPYNPWPSTWTVIGGMTTSGNSGTNIFTS